jgi:hypothetical protein
VEGACGALGVADGACDTPRVTDEAGSGSARAALVDRRAVGRRAVRCGKAGANRPYRTGRPGASVSPLNDLHALVRISYHDVLFIIK